MHIETSNSVFGKPFHYYETLPSTNSKLLQMARAGAKEGTVVCAGFQTDGRGRRGNTWQASAQKNMLISLLCKPVGKIESVLKITLAAALILQEAIETFYTTPLAVKLKWPNDLIVKKKKLAGILVESALKGSKIDSMVIGFGLNVNSPVSEMPAEINKKATSLLDITGSETVLTQFISHFLEIFELRYQSWNANNFSGVVTEWKKLCAHNADIHIQMADKIEEAQFHDLDADGFLLYRKPTGEIEKLISGNILY